MEECDITQCLKVYDPLYDIIVLKPKDPVLGKRRFWYPLSRKEDVLLRNQILQIVSTYEMNRLNFLRQSGLAFLVFPSSTHTRFAHSLGTYYLGEQAIQHSWVQVGKQIVSLKSWIEDDNRRLKDEFLVSLLLHDIGHLPFSHVLEDNIDLFSLDEQGEYLRTINHEEIACELILGEGPNEWAAALREWLSAKSNGPLDQQRFLSNVLAQFRCEPYRTDPRIICYLISGKDKYLPTPKELKETKGLTRIKKEDVQLLRGLTSGLIDLDRMDHYYRDSYFMGVELARFNIRSLINDLIFTDDGIKLKSDGVDQAISLLQSKENLVKSAFQNKSNLSYGAMLNFCVSEYMKDKRDSTSSNPPDLNRTLLCLTDDELLSELFRCQNANIKKVLFKVVNRQPFQLLKKYTISGEKCKNVGDVKRIQRNVFQKFDGDTVSDSDVLFYVPKGFGLKSNLDQEWLSLDRLMDEKGNYLSKKGYRRETEYFHGKQMEGVQSFWVFTDIKDGELKAEIQKAIDEQV